MKNSLPPLSTSNVPEGDIKAKQAPRIRSAYDGSRVRVRVICLEDEDKTQQSFRDECDINVLMKRYEQTGILPTGRDLPPQYADVSALDFADAQNKIAMVRGVFSQLDARTRARFENNPELMLEFVGEEGNLAEAVKLGLLPEEYLEAQNDAQSGGAVRGKEDGVSESPGSGGVRPGEKRVDIPGGNGGGGTSAVPAVESSPRDGKTA